MDRIGVRKWDILRGPAEMNTQPHTVTVILGILPVERREPVDVTSDTNVLQAIQRSVRLPRHVVRRGIAEVLASCNRSNPSPVNQDTRIGDLVPAHSDGNGLHLKFIVHGRTSPFGSHCSMAYDDLIQVICVGWPRDKREVIPRDNLHSYATPQTRLHSGLADQNRCWVRAIAGASPWPI